jgi:hypothetical protein
MILRGICILPLAAYFTVSAAFAQTADGTRSVKEIYASLSDADKQALFRLMMEDKAKTGRIRRSPATESHSPTVQARPVASAQAAILAPSPVVYVDSCDQSFFLRRDRTDVFSFLSPCGPGDVPGASISYTNDRQAKTQTFSVQALTGYTVKRGESADGNINYAITPSLYLNGSLGEPFKTTERNAMRVASDFEVAFHTPGFILRNHSVDIAPYYQTDYRGKGTIAGTDIIWEPYNLDIHLGGRYDEQARELVGIYWRVQGEADINHVYNAGLTNFVANQDHAFLGGTLQARMILFQNMPEFGALCGRIYVNATGQAFTDVSQGHGLSNYSAEVGYYLSNGVAPYWRFCGTKKDGEAPLPTASATSSAISLIYSNGTDKTTLVNQRQYKAQLSFRF